MNILSSEEMRAVEIALLKIAPHPKFVLKTPEERQSQNINHFEGKLFPSASHSVQKSVQKLVSLTDNLKSRKQSNSNSVFEMLTYTFLSILYQDKYRDQQSQSVHYLLETIKCSLYSSDIEFSELKNVDFQVDTLQMKALAARFLAFMEDPSLRLVVNRLKCAQWICENNPMLMNTFTLLFRFILSKLQIEEAINFKSAVNAEQMMVNLIEYFDLSYRSFGHLFLFHEDGIFMALVEKQIVVGDYFQNQSEKRNQKQKLQIKSSVKLNMIQSLIMSGEEKAQVQSGNGMRQKDLRMLGFMLDSGCQEDDSMMQQEFSIGEKIKESDTETPHFNDNPDQFHFGKRKSISTNDIKREFQQFTLDKSDCSQEYEGSDQQEAPTPFLSGEQNFSLAARFQQHPGDLKKVDSPIDELSSGRAEIKEAVLRNDDLKEDLVPVSANPVKYCSYEPVYTPQHDNNRDMLFSLGLDHQFCKSSLELKSTSDELKQLLNCGCRKIRTKRNAIVSNVVSIQFVPLNAKQKLDFKLQNNLRKLEQFHSAHNLWQNKDRPSLKMTAKSSKQFTKQPKDHKPSFLKTLKKNKQGNTQINFTKSTVTDNDQKEPRLTIQRKNSQQYFFNKNSIIMALDRNNNITQVASPRKSSDCKSTKSLNYKLGIFNRFDMYQEPRGTFGNPIQPLATKDNYENSPEISIGLTQGKPADCGQNSPSKVYIPPLKFYNPASVGYLNLRPNNFPLRLNQHPSSDKQINPESVSKKIQLQQTFFDQMKFMDNNSIPIGLKREKQF